MSVILIAVLLFVGILIVVGLGLMCYGLAGASRDDLLQGALIGMVVVILAGMGYWYFAHEPLRWEPNDAASSVSGAPGP